MLFALRKVFSLPGVCEIYIFILSYLFSSVSCQLSCYTCTSDPGGLNYEYCREVGIYHYVPMPPAFTCPSGKCMKMDVIVQGERSPRVYRFCDYDSVVTRELDNPYIANRNRYDYNQPQPQPLYPGYCIETPNIPGIKPLMNTVGSRVRDLNRGGQDFGSNPSNPNINPYNPSSLRGVKIDPNDPYAHCPPGRRPEDQSRPPFNRDDYNRGKRRAYRSLRQRLRRQVYSQDRPQVSTVVPQFSLDNLPAEQILSMRICRCDWDRCNSAPQIYSFISVLIGMVITAVHWIL